jgi:parallel beta-helix repeat protein
MQQTGRNFATTALVALVVGVVVAAGAAGPAAAGTATGAAMPESAPGHTLDSCGTIDEPGVYRLTADVENAPVGDCFEVTASDVSIHGDGHTVAAEMPVGAAVTASGVEDVVVQNLVVEGWQTGVAFEGVGGGEVTGSTFENVTLVGVELADGTSDVAVADNAVANSTDGVRVAAGGTDNVVAGNTLSSLRGTAVTVEAPETDVLNNSVTNAGDGGVAVRGTHSVLVAGNAITASDGGVVVDSSGGVSVRENTIDEASDHAVQVLGEAPDRESQRQFAAPDLAGHQFGQLTDAGQLSGVQQYPAASDTGQRDVTNRVRNNTVRGTNGHGIYLSETTVATVRGNELSGNRDGVHVRHSENVTVHANAVFESRDDGIHLANASDNRVTANNVSGNDDDGVYVVGSRNTLANNTARQNGDDGIDVHNATAVAVEANVLQQNGDDGLFFRSVHNSTVVSNVVGENRDDGIDLRGSTNNHVGSNKIYWNDQHQVVERQGSSGNTFENNTN